MANPILEKIDEIGVAWTEFRKVNDARLEELKKGNDARANEHGEALTKINAALQLYTKQRDDLTREFNVLRERMELAEALLDRPKGTPEEKVAAEHKEVFFKALRKGFQDHELNHKLRLIEGKQREMEGKDITLTAIGGGYGLPKEIAAEIEKLVLKFSDIVANVKQVTVGTSDYQELVSIFGGNCGWVAETATRTATGTPNLRNVKPTWGELYSYPQISEWSLQDIFFDVVAWLTQDISDGMAVALATSIWNGNGTANLTGMTNSAPTTTADYASPMRAPAIYQYLAVNAVGLDNTSPTKVTMDSIINLVYNLRPTYRQGAKFAMNSTVQGYVRLLKSTYGVYYWEPSVQLGQPDRLLGYPVFTWEDMGQAKTLNALAIAFGNFNRAYLLVNRRELNITQDNVTNPGYVRFWVRRRYGGMPLNNDAVKFLKVL
jgi:HK97 family phage major capsid protein